MIFGNYIMFNLWFRFWLGSLVTSKVIWVVWNDDRLIKVIYHVCVDVDATCWHVTGWVHRHGLRHWMRYWSESSAFLGKTSNRQWRSITNSELWPWNMFALISPKGIPIRRSHIFSLCCQLCSSLKENNHNCWWSHLCDLSDRYPVHPCQSGPVEVLESIERKVSNTKLRLLVYLSWQPKLRPP